MPDAYDPVPLDFEEYPPEEMREPVRSFRQLMARRRSVREFSGRPVPQALTEKESERAALSPAGPICSRGSSWQ